MYVNVVCLSFPNRNNLRSEKVLEISQRLAVVTPSAPCRRTMTNVKAPDGHRVHSQLLPTATRCNCCPLHFTYPTLALSFLNRPLHTVKGSWGALLSSPVRFGTLMVMSRHSCLIPAAKRYSRCLFPFPLPFLPLPFTYLPLSFPFLRSRPLNTARGSGGAL